MTFDELDRITQILARVSDESIAGLKEEHRAEVCRRLNLERARYEKKGCGMANIEPTTDN